MATTAVGKGKNQGVNKLVSSEEKYEFKKTAKHDVTESRYDSVWDISGRYLAIYGVKRSLLDKSDKSIKFYNILGEPLQTFEKIQNLQQFKWRPRPQVALKPKELQKIKAEFKNKYQKLFKEEEEKERKAGNIILKESKNKIREEFLNTFFIPLRQEYES